MSRLKKIEIIDRLIKNIQSITKNQSSLSEQDLKVLNEALYVLQNMKGKKGKTNEQILKEVVKVVELLTKFFL